MLTLVHGLQPINQKSVAAWGCHSLFENGEMSLNSNLQSFEKTSEFEDKDKLQFMWRIMREIYPLVRNEVRGIKPSRKIYKLERSHLQGYYLLVRYRVTKNTVSLTVENIPKSGEVKKRLPKYVNSLFDE